MKSSVVGVADPGVTVGLSVVGRGVGEAEGVVRRLGRLVVGEDAVGSSVDSGVGIRVGEFVGPVVSSRVDS